MARSLPLKYLVKLADSAEPFATRAIQQVAQALNPLVDAVNALPDAIVTEDWHAVGAGGEPAFANSWANYGAGFCTAAYFIDSLGIVHLRGLVKNGTAATIFTLPSGYRPSLGAIFPSSSNLLHGEIRVSAAGVVSMTAGTNAWISLDGISFRTA